MPQRTGVEALSSVVQAGAGAGAEAGADADSGQEARPLDAACVGETMALLVPDRHGTDGPLRFHTEIGGAESNVAVHLARAGRSAAWHSALGDDPFGRQVRERLADAGVHCRVRTDRERPTGLYMKEPRPHGTRVRYWRQGSAASTLNPGDAAEVWRGRPRLVHTTGITAALSASAAELVEELLGAAPEETLCSFDVNYRPALHDSRNAGRLLELARRADVVFCGLDEARSLWQVTGLAELRGLLPGPELLVAKQGAEGATALRGGESWFQPAPRVEVVEPVGAGDAFAAGFLDRLLDGAPMPVCLAEGARLAGIVLGIPGDVPPHPAGAPASCETDPAPAQGPHR